MVFVLADRARAGVAGLRPIVARKPLVHVGWTMSHRTSCASRYCARVQALVYHFNTPTIVENSCADVAKRVERAPNDGSVVGLALTLVMWGVLT